MLTAGEVALALFRWEQTAGGLARLINHSENLTFLIQAPAGERYTLRVHRPGYQSRASIESELSWLFALRHDTNLVVPQPVAGRNGEYLQTLETTAGQHMAVLFHFIPGGEPGIGAGGQTLFHTLGRQTATLHLHACDWPKPPGFDRQVWDGPAMLGSTGLWGDWRRAPGVEADNRPLLQELSTKLLQMLQTYGTAADRFGLIHADIRLGNLLVDNEQVAILDFDDCGFGWFAYDFAASISFHETDPAIPELRQAWLDGYRLIRLFPSADEAMLDTMVMLRRMVLLAWIGSHSETALAQQHAPHFARDTAALARRYLDGGIWS